MSKNESRPGLPATASRALLGTLLVALALCAIWYFARTRALESANLTLLYERDLADAAARLAEAQLAERTLIAERMIDDLGAQLRRSEDPSSSVLVRLAETAGPESGPRGFIVWHPASNRGWVFLEQLSALGAGKEYRLWAVDATRGAPHPVATVQPPPSGSCLQAVRVDPSVGSVAEWFLSIETGGSETPAGPVRLSSRP